MQTEIVVRNAMTRERVAKHFLLPTRAKQSFKEECDINNIMRKFEKAGTVDHLNTHQGQYGNFIGFEDYQTSLNQLLQADEAFSTIPARIRSRFNNDPAEFLEFAQNPANLEEMRAMGLAPPEAVEARSDETGPGATPTPEKSTKPPTTSPKPPEDTKEGAA